MRTILLRPNCGINLDNLPAQIFSYVEGEISTVQPSAGGGIAFHVDDDRHGTVINYLREARPWIVVGAIGNITEITFCESEDVRYETRAVTTDSIEEAIQQDRIPQERPSQEQERLRAARLLTDDELPARQRLGEVRAERYEAAPNHLGQTMVMEHFMTETQTTEALVQQGLYTTRYIETHAPMHEILTTPAIQTPMAQPVPTAPVIPMVAAAPVIPMVAAVPDEEVSIFLAQKMKNELSSRANLAKEAVTELSKLMAKAVLLNNKVNGYMRDLNGNVKISKVMAEIQTVSDQDYVEEAFVDQNGWLNIKTENIVTEVLDDDREYDIGKMLIKFNMNIMMNEIGNVTDTKILEIRNMTRLGKNEDGQEYECGHVLKGSQVCFGDGFPQLITALSNQDILMALMLVMKFIKNPNIDDAWGVGATYFPEVV